jgi:hypothetical protein
MIYDINLVYFFLRGGVNLGVALYSFQALSAMEFVIKVLHCNVEIVESETLMTFLADDKISENEAIVRFLWTLLMVEKRSHAISNRLVWQGNHPKSGKRSR